MELRREKYHGNQSMFRTIVVLLILVSLALSGCAAINSLGGNAGPGQQATPTPLPTPIIAAKPTYQVQRGQIINQINFSGRFVPVTENSLFFRTAGRVKEILVERGAEVKKDQVLARLEAGGPDEFEVRKAQINLAIAKLNLELAKTQGSLKDKDYAVTVAIKEQEVLLAQVDVDRLGNAAASAQITSPIDGVVTSIATQAGGSVDAYKVVIVVANLTQLEISANLSSDQLPQTSVGLKAQVAPAAGNGSPAVATIRSMPDSAGKQPDVRLSLDVPPAKAGYALGDRVNLSIVLEKKDNILWLPPQAIRDFNGRKFVIVQDAAGQRRLDVKVGIQTDEKVEIVDGLSEGLAILGQ
jgi:membrane fusion protein, macrolide-specific efflux system